jgi:opacity protein-like surface antigen
MRQSVAGLLVAGILSCTAASAADLGRPAPAAPPVAVPATYWSGFYSGVYIGYGFDDLTATVLGVNVTPLPEPTGFFFGSNIG